MELWIATGNQGKFNEFKTLLNRLIAAGLQVHSQKELPVFSSPPENGDSYLANARIKARALKSLCPGKWVVADDSGLEVEGLNNLPGIHSARYAGPHAADSENVAKLLKMMAIRHITNRNAAFVCQLVAFDPAGTEHLFSGRMQGKIVTAGRGTGGFGYDPVFVPEGETKTLAELDLARKNQISHRAKAVSQFSELLNPI